MASEKHRALGGLIMLAAGIVALILVLHIVFVLIGANGGNTIVSTDANWASHLAAWFHNLFTTSSPNWNTVLNYGLAALVYLVLGRLVASFAERI